MDKISKFGIFTLLLISSLTIMVGTVIAPSLSAIAANQQLGFSPSWLITLPSLGVVLSATMIGRLLNTLGSLRLLVFGLVPYALLGVLGAYITNDYVLILDRILLGTATVAVQVSVTAFMADLFTGEDRLKMIAWQGMSIELGGVVFLALGGVLGEWHWQFPFYIYLIALVCLVLVAVALPKSGHSTKETKEISPAGDTGKSEVRLLFLASLLAMMLFFVGFVSLPLYLPNSFGFSESQTGYLMASISVVAIITASQMPKMVKALGGGKTVALGFLFFMMGYMVLATTLSVPFLVLTVVFIGTGFGFTIPLLNHLMIEVSSTQNLGKNLGLFSMGVFGGQFLSTFIESLSNNYKAIYGVSSVLALLIACSIYFLFQRIVKK
ncbi:MFS transporter [Maribacter polysaccharolyticus]|uniref:MFS transporter n=1 Tax=Maribacter polysaccharolyticus TaxID=3020831 RepID=UPI00237F9120|nr:MFS transporter [Maribacter polysaccharolyticus]MDE3741783.1 MFS transporter [Maribacter polysaccharolyticus]